MTLTVLPISCLDTFGNQAAEEYAAAHRREEEDMTTATKHYYCTACQVPFKNPQALGAHRRHHHPKPVPEPMKTPLAVEDKYAHTTPTFAALEKARLEAHAPAAAPKDTIGDLLGELAECRVELMMHALREKLGDDAERFASDHIFPAIEAAERAAEVM